MAKSWILWTLYNDSIINIISLFPLSLNHIHKRMPSVHDQCVFFMLQCSIHSQASQTEPQQKSVEQRISGQLPFYLNIDPIYNAISRPVDRAKMTINILQTTLFQSLQPTPRKYLQMKRFKPEQTFLHYNIKALVINKNRYVLANSS